MNQLMIVVVVLVLFCYFGGKYCPSVLKKNKEILLGLAGGLVLCSFFGLRLEGFCVPTENTRESPPSTHKDADGLASLCPVDNTPAGQGAGECNKMYCTGPDWSGPDQAAHERAVNVGFDPWVSYDNNGEQPPIGYPTRVGD